jgi:recombination protein RecA
MAAPVPVTSEPPAGRRVRPITRPTAGVPRVIPSGSTLLDLQNGGGWALGRMANIVGDSSSGKTLLAIEACANFSHLYGVDNIRYCESEAAFDERYAQSLGLPPAVSLAQDIRTVEDFNADLEAFLKKVNGPALYCLDSADALSDQSEMERAFDEGSYGAAKAKAFSKMFRQQIAMLEEKNCCLIIISQIRDNIGVTFGPKKTRSGGHALDFYASQIVWLHEASKEKRTITGVERVVGINVRAQNRKNKISQPFREVEFLLIFNYGVDDELSMINWLKKNKADETGLSLPLDRYAMAVRRARDARDVEKLSLYAGELRAATKARWFEIEAALQPPMSKYAPV